MTFKEKYWKYSLVIIITVLGLILFNETRPFLSGILGASTIYILMRKQLFYLVEKKRFRPSIASLLLLFEAILLFLIPLSLTVWMVIDRIQTFDLNLIALFDSFGKIADTIRQKTGFDLFDKANLSSIIASLPKIGQILMSEISGFTINAIVLVLVLYFMFIGGRKMETYIFDIIPFSPENKPSVKKEIGLIVRSNAIGVPLLAIVQGLVAFSGYLLFHVSSPVFFAFLTCIATIIPVVGTALIWFPLCIYLALTGAWGNAIGLFLFSVLIITNVDNFFRFILQKKMADTHPLITIFGVIFGFSIFGFMGVIFGPLLLSIFIFCFNIFKKEYLD